MKGPELLRLAQSRGLLPEQAVWPAGDERPWAIKALIAAGAWLAAVPLMGVLGALLHPLLREGGSIVVLGLLCVALGLALQRGGAPMFLQQLALPPLLVGLGCLGFGIGDGAGLRAGLMATGLACLLVSVLLSRAWLRLLLGLAVAMLWLLAWHLQDHGFGWRTEPWQMALLLLAVLPLWWLPRTARWTAWGEALGSGWVLGLLTWMVIEAGSSWLISGLASASDFASHWRDRPSLAIGPVEVLLAAGLLAWRWSGLRGWRWGAAALCLSPLAWALPAFGNLALAAVLCALQGRVRLLLSTAFATLWVLGSFYYRIEWSLQDKAIGLLALGAALALLARWPQRQTAAAPVDGPPWRTPALGAGLLLGLLVVNGGIAQKEWLIRHGAPLFVELAPVDPRSLMQGDYMRLDYGLTRNLQLPAALGAERPRLVLRRDGRGVAQLQRVDGPQALGEGEFLLELTPKDGRWTVVSDAWFFKEGEAARWQAARYGEFRVRSGGQAVLVGLRDAALRPL